MRLQSIFARGACLLALAGLAPTASAQDLIGDGFAQTSTQVLPAAFASYATLSSGERVVFDGLSFDLYDAGGGFLLNLGTLPNFVFNSFVEVDPSETFAVCGESSNGDLFKVALDGTGFTTLANLNFNFAADFEDATNLVVSAATCGFGCGNDLVRVDTSTGATTFFANVAGASGPVAVADNGDVYYGSVSGAFPAPPGSANLLRWTAAQVHGGLLLTELDAVTVSAAFDGAASMDIDPAFGNVFLAESIFGGTSRIYEVDPITGDRVDVVVESTNYLSTLEFGDKGGNGHCHAYQPDTGTYLIYSNGDVATVEPQRPQSSITYLGNVVNFDITGAKPNSGVLVTWGPSSTWGPTETSYALSFDFLYHTGIPLGQVRRFPWYLPTDANGDATFSYFDFQNLAGTLVFQALISDENGKLIGSSAAAFN